MAKVIPVGPIDPVLYGFAKKQAEKAERDPRYVPKRLETPAHSITYRRVGATVKAFVIDKIAPVWAAIEPQLALPVVQHISPEDIPDDELEIKTSNSPAIQIRAIQGSPVGEYVSKATSNRELFTTGRSDCARMLSRRRFDITDGAIVRTAICESPAEIAGIGINFSSTRLEDNTEPFAILSEPIFGHTMLGIELENNADINFSLAHIYHFGYQWLRTLSSLASWHGPVLRKIATSWASGTSGAYKKEFHYNYTKNQTAYDEEGIVYIAPNKNNFSATQASDISNGILEEVTYTRTTNLIINPEDFGFFYIQEYSYSDGWRFKVKLDRVPVTTTTISTVTSSAGRMTVAPEMVGFDRAGNVFHVERIEHWMDDQSSPIGYVDEENGYGTSTSGVRSRFDFQNISRPYLKNAEIEQTEIAVFRNKSEKIISVLLEDDLFAVRQLYCSSEPQGGAALIVADKYSYIDHELGSRFSIYSVYRYGHACLLDNGLYIIGAIVKDGSTSSRKMCVAFFPNPEPGNKYPIFRIDKHYKNFYLLLPHKNYDLEEPPDQDRFAKSALFVGRNRRCYISFDDGVCMDLTDFSDARAADPNISAEDWDGKPFDYSPIEEWDDDQNKFDPESAPARRIKRAYAPQWVRAYYDYEDQP